jgi:hypothetical protein
MLKLWLIHQKCVLEQKKNSILKLVAKIYLCLATKIIYADSAEMENNFYKNIYIITLCNVWHRS